jgi:hypothetical protein
MRALLAVCILAGCSSSEDLGTQKQKLSEDYPLTLEQATAAIEAHDGDGCLRMDSFVACRGCAPQYRLDPVADGASVGPCGRSTFVAGRVVRTRNEKTFTWTCASSPLGGSWNGEETGALVCRE